MTMVEITCFSCGEVKYVESATWDDPEKAPYGFPVLSGHVSSCNKCGKQTEDVVQAYNTP